MTHWIRMTKSSPLNKISGCVKALLWHSVSLFFLQIIWWRFILWFEQWVFETSIVSAFCNTLVSDHTPLLILLFYFLSFFSVSGLPGISLSSNSLPVTTLSPTLSWGWKLHFPQNGCWGRLSTTGQRCAAEAGDFPSPWGLSHRRKYDRLWHLRRT